MIAYDVLTRCKDGSGGLQMYTMPGTLIFDQREKLVEIALSEGADAVLFIDSDMRFPKDLIQILLSREADIVGVNATSRRQPVLPCALNLEMVEDNKENEPDHRWVKVDSRGKEGIEQVTAVGFGVVMIRKQAFEKIPRPWFDVGWGRWGIIGEDVHFCARAADNGIPVYVDHSLSKHIKHIGIYEYGWDDIDDAKLKELTDGPNKLQRPKNDSRKLSSKK
jgi:hypothetical protein